MSIDGKVSVLITILLVIGVAATIYITINPQPTESYTDFYLLGPQGNASDYPINLTTGEIGNVIIGVVNRENQNTNYQLIVKQNQKTKLVQNISLQSNQKTEIPFNFTAGTSGQEKIEFFLYKLPDQEKIYRSLFLLVNIN